MALFEFLALVLFYHAAGNRERVDDNKHYGDYSSYGTVRQCFRERGNDTGPTFSATVESVETFEDVEREATLGLLLRPKRAHPDNRGLEKGVLFDARPKRGSESLEFRPKKLRPKREALINTNPKEEKLTFHSKGESQLKERPKRTQLTFLRPKRQPVSRDIQMRGDLFESSLERPKRESVEFVRPKRVNIEFGRPKRANTEFGRPKRWNIEFGRPKLRPKRAGITKTKSSVMRKKIRPKRFSTKLL